MSGHLRASDADRDQVTEVLHAAYAEGRISYDEHSERTVAAPTARTFEDLSALTADLVPAEPASAAQVAVPDRAEPERVTAMLAETKRTGPWLAPRAITVNVLPGTAVRVEAANVLGDSSVKQIGEPDDRQPTVLIRGTNILGDISARGPKRPSIWKRNVA